MAYNLGGMDDTHKAGTVGPATGASIQPNQSVWVEYVNPTVHTTSATMTLAVSTADGTTTDIVVFHSFQSCSHRHGWPNSGPAQVR